MSENQIFEGVYTKGNPLSHSSSSSRITGISNEIIVRGQEATIHKANILSVGSYDVTQHPLPVVIRRMRNNFPSRQDESYFEQVLEKHRRLRSCNLPVLPTFRFDIHSNSYLLTDLTHDGSVVIDKHTDPSVTDRYRIDNASELDTQLKDITTKAYNFGNGVLLGYDAYLLTVKNHVGTIHLVDIFTGSYLLDNHSVKQLKYPVSISHALIRAQAFYDDVVKPLNKTA